MCVWGGGGGGGTGGKVIGKEAGCTEDISGTFFPTIKVVYPPKRVGLWLLSPSVSCPGRTE